MDLGGRGKAHRKHTQNTQREPVPGDTHVDKQLVTSALLAVMFPVFCELF